METWHPALIFMDVRMPVMDGLQTTRRIREIESAGVSPRCAILALTAGAFEHEREEMLQCGADDFVAKPFRVAALFEKIGKYLDVQFVYEESEAAEGGSASRAATLASGLRDMPAELRRDLREALSSGHVRQIQYVVERVRDNDEALGRALLTEVHAFRLDALLALLDQTDPGPPEP